MHCVNCFYLLFISNQFHSYKLKCIYFSFSLFLFISAFVWDCSETGCLSSLDKVILCKLPIYDSILRVCVCVCVSALWLFFTFLLLVFIQQTLCMFMYFKLLTVCAVLALCMCALPCGKNSIGYRGMSTLCFVC